MSKLMGNDYISLSTYDIQLYYALIKSLGSLGFVKALTRS